MFNDLLIVAVVFINLPDKFCKLLLVCIIFEVLVKEIGGGGNGDDLVVAECFNGVRFTVEEHDKLGVNRIGPIGAKLANDPIFNVSPPLAFGEFVFCYKYNKLILHTFK